MRIRLEQVGKHYRSTGEILRGIDLRAEPGEFISILGPSGCGKSTLLRLIAGLETPTSGSITLAGAAAGTVSSQAMSVVFQDARLLPWRSARANVRLPLELLGRRDLAHRQRVMDVLQMVGLAPYADTYPAELSGGMKMRVSLARALVTSPELLLLDEPFGALDEITRQALNDELLRLWQVEQWTAIFVTHNIFEAIYLSQRIIVLGRHPGVIRYCCQVPFSYPRAPELRTDPAFGRLAAELMSHLEHVNP